jgi:hypothetical protein
LAVSESIESKVISIYYLGEGNKGPSFDSILAMRAVAKKIVKKGKGKSKDSNEPFYFVHV